MTDFYLRPFGILPADLAVDLSDPRHPQLVTQILHGCLYAADGSPLSREALADQEVGRRLEWLLRILARSGVGSLAVSLVCVNEACLQRMEVILTIGELVALQQESQGADSRTVAVGQGSLTLRRPTARDQLHWAESIAGDDDLQAQVDMANSLRVGAEEDDEIQVEKADLPRLDEAMQRFDPLVAFGLEARCPFCEEQHDYEVDLLELSLLQLRRLQGRLLESVHLLASHYHWTEAEIVAMPVWRRQRYLTMVQRERDL